MKFLSIIAASIAVLLGPASAATIAVVNGDMEAGGPLANTNTTYGDWELGISGWQVSGTGGVFDPVMTGNAVYEVAPAEIGTRIAWLANGASAYQTLTEVITAGKDYTLTALFGNRYVQNTMGGQFGFYAGDVSNIIALTDITDPGDGYWSEQSLTLTATLLSNYVNQQLGVVILGHGSQLNFDLVRVTSPDQVPLPAAVWLFGTALAGGGLIARKRKKKTA